MPPAPHPPSHQGAVFADRSALWFDLDGILIDSGTDLATALNRLLREDSLPALVRPQVVAMLGDGAPILIERAYRHFASAPPGDTLARYRRHYRRRASVLLLLPTTEARARASGVSYERLQTARLCAWSS